MVTIVLCEDHAKEVLRILRGVRSTIKDSAAPEHIDQVVELDCIILQVDKAVNYY